MRLLQQIIWESRHFKGSQDTGVRRYEGKTEQFFVAPPG